MRNFIFFVIFLAFAHPAKPQSLSVEYKETISGLNGSGSLEFNTILLADSNLSYYIMFFDQKRFKKIVNVVQDKDDDDMTYRAFKILDVGDKSTLIFNKADNRITQDFLDHGTPTIILDDTVKFDWQITEETKLIQNFKCTKATLKFRGRDFIAWFTTEIPVSYGPWKFHGLPGLILEVYDVDKLCTWSATKIQYPVNLDKKLKPEHSGENFRTISLRTYLNEKEKRRDDEDKMRRSKMPKGSSVIESTSENNSLELVYEWEYASEKKLKD